MSHSVDSEVGGLLAAAEELGSCLVVSDEIPERLLRGLERRVGSGEVASPARGLFVRADLWDELKRDQQTLFVARGLQALHPDWVFCGPTAAVAYGVDVSWSLQDAIHVATTRSGFRGGAGPVRRHAVLPEDEGLADVRVAGGLRVTPPERTVFDCLRRTDFPLGLGVADSALRQGVVTAAGLAAFVDSVPRDPRGRAQALGTLAWADPRSENGGESIARGRMLLLGYVRPELQVEVPRVIERGEPYRADFCWVRADGLVILGELDGRLKYTEEEMMGGRDLGEVLSDENVRGSRFSLYDVSLMRFGFPVTERPAAFAAILDEYGVPKRGGPLALPEGTPMVPDWEALRRNRR